MTAKDWHPTAAYLYVLRLDNSALAWEYVRRNPDYRRDWIAHARQPAAARRWHLRWFENPSLDARTAHPCWLEDENFTHLTGSSDGESFELWKYPGRKHVLHDGCRLLLTIQHGHESLRMALDERVQVGRPVSYLIRAGARARRDWAAVEAQQRALRTPPTSAAPRPAPHKALHMSDLQALDGLLAGASQREIAEQLFGELTGDQWAADGDLRARVRHSLNRARRLMQGGYRRLLTQTERPAQGLFSDSKRSP